MKLSLFSISFVGYFILHVTLYSPLIGDELKSLNSIVTQLKKLEDRRDPKCYATATRLENFMYGTPLNDEARFKKNLLQKKWILNLWENTSKRATSSGNNQISADDIFQERDKVFTLSQTAKKNWKLQFYDQNITINEIDKRHYSSVAYSLRALMAVQQDVMLNPSSKLLPLSKKAVDAAKDALDFFTLSALQLADNKARLANEYLINTHGIETSWNSLMIKKKETARVQKNSTIAKKDKLSINNLTMLKSVITQKLSSYEVYNEINNQLFVRNLQVYFARLSWPKDKEEAKLFRQLFTETLIAFAGDLYLGAQKLAMQRGHTTIQEKDVFDLLQRFLPHEINEYEDAIFFPHLKKEEQIVINAYDMDAFRDSGIHWKYLEYAINSKDFPSYLEPDPFAAELITENIAQFGVLILRITGIEGKKKGDKRLKTSQFIDAMHVVQNKIKADAKAPRKKEKESTSKLASASNNTAESFKTSYFTDVTSAVGIKSMHRSSDWLSRMLRSYLKKDKYRGVITIPPAFGGAGVASDDINNDGYPDILILSGLGNKLYINEKGKGFKDVSEESGLLWVRPEDKHPGEPRQPLIADLDNDGYKDIIITYVNDLHRVYRNRGDGTFEDMSEKANLGGLGSVSGPAALIDIDNDGLLDLYVTYFGDYIKGVLPTLKRRNDNGRANQLFKNKGNFVLKI